MLWRQAAFCGIEIVTYAMMANHFHVLARVPEPVELSDGQLLERLQAFYGRKGFLPLLAQDNIKQQGRSMRGCGSGCWRGWGVCRCS